MKTLDLSRIPTLTDDGLEEICRFDAEELLLQGSSKGLTSLGYPHLATTKRLRLLDLRGWPKDEDAPDLARTLRRMFQRQGLTIRR